MANGEKIPYSEENKAQIMQLMMTGAVLDYEDIDITAVRCCTFFDRTLLEDIASPYKHGEFSYVPMIYQRGRYACRICTRLERPTARLTFKK